MSFLIYLFVLMVAAASLLFGLDLMTAPLRNTPNVPIGRTVQIVSQPPAEQRRIKEADERALTPVYSTKLGEPKVGSQVPDVVRREEPKVVTSDTSRVGLHVDDKSEVGSARGEEHAAHQPTAGPPAAPPPLNNVAQTPQISTDATVRQSSATCNVQACGAAFYSFRESDCTYQPISGARRACAITKGLVTPITGPRSKEQQAARQLTGKGNLREAEPIATRQPLDVRPAQYSNGKSPMSETERIVRNMTSDDEENITVQDGEGRIFIVRKSYH